MFYIVLSKSPSPSGLTITHMSWVARKNPFIMRFGPFYTVDIISFETTVHMGLVNKGKTFYNQILLHLHLISNLQCKYNT